MHVKWFPSESTFGQVWVKRVLFASQQCTLLSKRAQCTSCGVDQSALSARYILHFQYRSKRSTHGTSYAQIKEKNTKPAATAAAAATVRQQLWCASHRFRLTQLPMCFFFFIQYSRWMCCAHSCAYNSNCVRESVEFASVFVCRFTRK